MVKRDAEGPQPPSKAPRFVSAIDEYASNGNEFLKAGVIHAVNASGVRHAFETEVLEMGGRVLEQRRQSIHEEHQASVLRSQDAEADLRSKQEAHSASQQFEKQASAVRDEKAAAALNAEEIAANALYEHGRISLAKDKVSAEKALLLEERERSLPFLQEGWQNMDAAVVKEHVSLKSIGAEPALLAALPGTLAMNPDQRSQSAFDKLVAKAVSQALQDRATCVDEMIEKKNQEEREAESFLLGAWAFKDVTASQASTAAEQMHEAEKNLSNLKDGVLSAQGRVDEQLDTVTRCLSEQNAHFSKLEQVDSALSELQTLLTSQTQLTVEATTEVVLEEPKHMASHSTQVLPAAIGGS